MKIEMLRLPRLHTIKETERIQVFGFGKWIMCGIVSHKSQTRTAHARAIHVTASEPYRRLHKYNYCLNVLLNSLSLSKFSMSTNYLSMVILHVF